MSPRRAGVLLALVVVVCASCAALFDEPAQCKLDRDCERFTDAVCDIAHAVCVPRASLPEAGDVPEDDGGADAGTVGDGSVAKNCDISPKPVAVVDAKPFTSDAGASGEITSDLTLDCTKDWLLKGRVFVRPGVTLTIDPGTTIRGEKASNAGLVVSAGAKIVAAGERDKPIVFTSDQATPAAGDWRGLFVLGLAPPSAQEPFNADPALSWGGVNAMDNSGVLTFVRIEYGLSGLVLAGVGKQTKLDSIQVRRPGGTQNCFFFYGGTADAKHLVCQYPADEHFEFGIGYAGRVQFLFGHKTPTGAVYGRNGVLTDDATAVIYNATICGDSAANNGYGLLLRDNSKLDVNDAIFTGWFAGIDATGTLGAPLTLRSSIFFANATNPAYAEDAGVVDPDDPFFDDDNGFDEIALFNASGTNTTTNPGLVDCYDPKAPKPWPAASLTAGARTPPNDGFFDTTASYIGAFKDQNDPWMTGAWVRFDDK